jgi:hypothetical protein
LGCRGRAEERHEGLRRRHDVAHRAHAGPAEI